MPRVPDRRRQPPAQNARALVAPLVEFALTATWRVLHPEERVPFVEAPAPPPARRVYYTASDGWSAPLRRLDPAVGGPGEPVVLAHALGLSADAWRYGADNLARCLQRAGFTVYLLAHRGDRDAVAPAFSAGGDFDDVVGRDVPAALDAVARDSGYPRAFWVGHGLGGQLAAAWVARSGGEGLAGVAALNTAVRFTQPSSEVRRLLAASRWLPRSWRLRSELASVMAPWVGEGPLLERFAGSATRPERVRGVLHHGAEDVPVRLLRQVAQWYEQGTLCDRTGQVDYSLAVSRAEVPLFCVVSEGDDLCRPAQGLPLAHAWGHDDRTELRLSETFGHDDALFSDQAADAVHKPLVDWLIARRRRAWRGDDAAGG